LFSAFGSLFPRRYSVSLRGVGSVRWGVPWNDARSVHYGVGEAILNAIRIAPRLYITGIAALH
jgi:hypothetical protein